MLICEQPGLLPWVPKHMAAPKPKKINLLVKEGFENSQIGKILSWLLTVGRAIVIVVELVVICAFLSRFWLDRQLTDLVENNNNKRVQIEASNSFEQDFTSLQKRLAVAKQIDGERLTPSLYTKEATKLLPHQVILSDISFNQDKFSFAGVSSDEAGLAGFIKALEKSDKFTNVTLDTISLNSGETFYINFTVRANPEKKG